MKAQPLTRYKCGRFKIDLFAVRLAIYKGTLKPQDRVSIERILPGVCAQIEAEKANATRGAG